MKEFADEQIQEIEEDITNVDFIVKIVGGKLGYYRGQSSDIKPSSKKFMNGIQEQLQAHQKKA